MKRKVVLFDMDGVLCDYTGKLLLLAHEKLGLPLYKAKEVSMFNSEWVFPKEFHAAVDALSMEPGFFESLDPLPYAVEAFHEIADPNDDDGAADVYICTSPKRFHSNPHCLFEKSAWVAKHLGKEYVDRIIFTRDKTLVSGHVLIDDKPIVSGSRVPDWTHVYYNQPYNKSSKGPRITSWKKWGKTLLPLLQVT